METDLTREATADGRSVDTLRERIELHRQNPVCAACHQIMDPIGLSLENFDLIGRWRTTENGVPLDTRTQLIDGTAIDGPAALREALLLRGESLVTTLTEKLLVYALGRALEPADMPAVRAVVAAAAAEDYRFSAIVLGIVASDPFRRRTASGQGDVLAQREEQGP